MHSSGLLLTCLKPDAPLPPSPLKTSLASERGQPSGKVTGVSTILGVLLLMGSFFLKFFRKKMTIDRIIFHRIIIYRIMFLNRENELNFLNSSFQENKKKLLIIYGRRRIGKTELIKQFINKVGGVYHMVDTLSLSNFLNGFAEQAHNSGFMDLVPKLQTLDDFFGLIQHIARTRKVIVALDEFQRLTDIDSEFIMGLQGWWDSISEGVPITLILLGSSVGLIEKMALSHDSPIYGRRSGQIHLKPLTYFEALPFFSDREVQDRVSLYSVFGGTPSYLMVIDSGKTVLENIETQILSKNSRLYEEPKFLLAEETREPLRYMDILSAIAQGSTTYSSIGNRVGISSSDLNKYLVNLSEGMDLVAKQYPVGRERKRGEGRYHLSDNFLSFWYMFVRPYRDALEIGGPEPVSRIVKKELDMYVSRKFEDITLQHMLLKFGKDHSFTQIGRWWYKELEIDGVAIDESDNTVYFMEAKWTEKPLGREVLNDLIRKSSEFRWANEIRQERFIIYSKSGFSFSDESVTLISLNEL